MILLGHGLSSVVVVLVERLLVRGIGVSAGLGEESEIDHL